MSERTCIVTRTAMPPERLVRFVLSPDDEVTPDLKRRLPGRGVWVSASRVCMERAVRKGLFSGGFRRRADCAAELPETVHGLLRREALDLLGLCNRAGLVAAGFEKAMSLLAKGAVAALLVASDASRGTRDGIARKIRAAGNPPRLVAVFGREDLSMALGRTNVVHVAVRKGDLADRLVVAAERYGNYDG